MKKIVALGAIAALACGMVFADEPAIDIKVAELSGNAQVKWGVDLDAGQHGFSNSNEATLKVNLWNEGTKETTSDDAIGGGDVWAEIQVKGKALALKNKAWDGDGNASLEKATLHIGQNFYVDIKSGDLKVGEYKPDVAIHGDYAWLASKGWGNFKNGIEAGYDAAAFKFSLGFRSYKATNTDYTSAYGFKVGAELKDGDDALVPGLSVVAGLGMNLSTDYKDAAGNVTVKMPKDYRTEAETKDNKPDNASNKDSVADHEAKIIDWDKGLAKEQSLMKIGANYLKDPREISYGVKAAYKLAIDDTYYVKPSVGFNGRYVTATKEKNTFGLTEDKSYTYNENALAFGVLFGWGEQKDAKAGVPFLDIDGTKKVTPGVSVAAYIPLPSTSTTGDKKTIEYDSLQALIAPSFYLGEDLVTGLKAAVYSEIGIYKYIENDSDKNKTDGNTTTLRGSSMKDETFAFALAAGLSYGIPVEDYTITPSAGFRYVNGAYIGNDLPGKYSDIFRAGLGLQSKATKDAAKDKHWSADFFNLKIGCDFAGFINNTIFSVNYNSANLLNTIGTEDTDPTYKKDTKYYNVKAGQLDVGCKISL